MCVFGEGEWVQFSVCKVVWCQVDILEGDANDNAHEL